jgi:hypothetical protein
LLKIVACYDTLLTFVHYQQVRSIASHLFVDRS